MKKFSFLIFFIGVFLLQAHSLVGQLLQGIGSWRDHFPYSKNLSVCKTGSSVFSATPYSIVVYNTSDKSIQRISKANYLSDVGITAMAYDPYSNKVIVGYENGNIDLITTGSGINVPAIRLSSIIGDKTIYDIFPYQDRVYLSTGFGIVVLDAKNLEIRDTYFIGDQGNAVKVMDIAIDNQRIYAACETGLKSADINNSFLANFENWTSVSDLPSATAPTQIIFFNQHMVLVIPNGTHDLIWWRNTNGGSWSSQFNGDYYQVRKIWTDGYWMTVAGNYSFQILQEDFDYFHNIDHIQGESMDSNYCIIDEYGHIWSADNNAGLVHTSYFTPSIQELIRPQGPRVADVRRIAAYNNNIWVAHGGVYPYWGNLWKTTGISAFVNEQWKGISADTLGNFTGCNDITPFVADFMTAAVNPNNNSKIYFGSYEDGLIEVDGNTMKGKNKNATNPSSNGPKPMIETSGEYSNWTGVAGITFDANGVLWCTNSLTYQGIHAMDKNGNFYDFNTSSIIGTNSHLGDIIVGNNGYVYAIVVGKGLLVLNHNGTLANYSDDSYKLMTDVEGDGHFPSKDVLSISEDLDGEIWVGTAQGLVVIYNPESIFSDENYDAEPILIQQDGNNQYLLETEAINAIKIDGSNRKWIGTRNSGAFLFSDDGLNEVYHFTDRNSPLPNNNVYDIAINHENGEVFFGTEKGIMGFFSTATNFDNEMKSVRVFPNPVRPEYDGNITIDGLAYDTNVKVTDIQGNILFETMSEGGRAIWNGKRFDGERPTTGVYLIFVTTKDGRADEVKKITFIR